MLATLFCLLACPAVADQEDAISLPSGLEARLQEMLWDQPGDGLVYRFRFVSEDFTGDEAFETQSVDLEYLCNHYALERLAGIGPQPSRIVISLSDRESTFGQFDPNVAQVFESFSLEGESCIWEMH
ncbi:MAG: DUF6497 family protein [Pseudomonadota bacterium]